MSYTPLTVILADACLKERATETQRLKVKKQDEALRQGLETLRPFLPNLARDSPHKSDYLPHVASIAHLRRRFLPIASRLLDGARYEGVVIHLCLWLVSLLHSLHSLNDMCERHELFEELVEGWFKCFAMHESLAALLAQVRGSVLTEMKCNNS